MKILSLSNCPLDESQGSGYIILNFCRGLREQGHDIELFGPDSYELIPFLQGRAKSYRQTLGMLSFTLQQLTKKAYDVVEFYGGESWLAASILHKLPNRTFLLVSHSNGLETFYRETLISHYKAGHIPNPFPKWYQFNQARLFINAFTKVDALVTVSQQDKDYAIKHNYKPESKLLCIENSLPDDYLSLPVSFQREPIIGYCGSWLPNKGIHLIQSDITQVLIDFPECSFKLIGVGDRFQKEMHFPKSVCSRIEVIPFVPKRELRNIYQELSILVVPSIYESFALVTAEAMACGCAVVARKIGFAANLKPYEEAVIIEQPVSPLLYEGVRELLVNEPLRMKIAKAGYQRVQNLRWNLAVKQLESTYTRWLDELRQGKS